MRGVRDRNNGTKPDPLPLSKRKKVPIRRPVPTPCDLSIFIDPNVKMNSVVFLRYDHGSNSSLMLAFPRREHFLP